ncbi:GUSB [Cordylochernes scorpioides]|uniref:GUSB n=1 Tax=Cordylochernes scorpioides TaxID=51811 RepID=A0ABY6K0E6_9ARAC|nr:GUSB [Cordylochernes scorpioides]
MTSLQKCSCYKKGSTQNNSKTSLRNHLSWEFFLSQGNQYLCQSHVVDVQGGQLDLVMMNRYYGWYADFGHLDVIPYQVTPDIRNCHVIFNHKLIIMSEYGADTVAGLHGDNFFVGELVWNFADFMTMPGLTRVVGNKKGVFTRERQPKAAAHLLRCRYHKLFQMNTDDLYCK